MSFRGNKLNSFALSLSLGTKYGFQYLGTDLLNIGT